MTTLHFPPLVSIMVKNYLLVSLFNRAGHGAIRHEITHLPARLATQLLQEAASSPAGGGEASIFSDAGHKAIITTSRGASANQRSLSLRSSLLL